LEKKFARSSVASRSVDALRPLFGRLAVEVLMVGLGVLPRMVDNAVAMIGRRIERVELQRNTGGIDDVVIRPRRDEHRKARTNGGLDTVKNSLSGPLFYPEELIEPV
jgi:hypothetical protein